MTSIEQLAIGWVVTEAVIQKIVDGQNEYDWTKDDVADFVEALAIMGGHTKYARATEAQLGSNPVWQSVCDDFAVESGCGLRICNEDDSNGMHNADDGDKCDSAGPLLFLIAVHACREDKIAPLEAVHHDVPGWSTPESGALACHCARMEAGTSHSSVKCGGTKASLASCYVRLLALVSVRTNC
eukprot:scaffold3453_cov256-Chaetoceros_neogracile.AAC.7